MKKETFCEILGEIRDEHIAEARDGFRARKPALLKWAAAAACLCLVIFAVSKTIPRSEHPDAGVTDAALPPTITIMEKNYTAPDMPVEKLPAGYHYLRDLTEKEANGTGLAGCAIYVDPQDRDMNTVYLYQECGTPIDEDTVDNTRRQWAYVQWSAVPETALDGDPAGYDPQPSDRTYDGEIGEQDPAENAQG